MPNEAFTAEEHAESRALAQKAPSPINVFSQGQSSAVAAGAAAGSDQARAVAETQAAMVIAKRFPRDQVAAMDRILNAFSRQSLAEQAQYTYSRGGTDITGPSIRAAEAIAQQWGNLQYGVRELDSVGGMSSVEAFAWDVETNTRQVKVFQVPHVRFTKKGSYKLEDPRDIYELIANQGARRLRACILGIVPGDVVESAMQQADVTLSTKAEVTPERLTSLVEKFAAFSVTKEQIEKRIQRRIEAMTPTQMVNLGKVFNSLTDGMSNPGDWFELTPEQEGAQPASKSASDALKAATRKGKDAPAATETKTGIAETKPTIGDTKAGDVETKPDPAKGGREVTYAYVLDQMEGAAKKKDVGLLDAHAATLIVEAPAEHHVELKKKYQELRAQIAPTT